MKKIKKYCVYYIYNKINHKRYFGVTSNFKKRMIQHKYKANFNMEYNIINRFYDDINFYKWINFDCGIIIENLSKYRAKLQELRIIKEYIKYENIETNTLYNIVYNKNNGGTYQYAQRKYNFWKNDFKLILYNETNGKKYCFWNQFNAVDFLEKENPKLKRENIKKSISKCFTGVLNKCYGWDVSVIPNNFKISKTNDN